MTSEMPSTDEAPTGGTAGRRRTRALLVAVGVVAVLAAVGVTALLVADGSDDAGPDSFPPPNGVVVDVPAGTDIQAVVDANQPGTTFRLGAGVHRGQTIEPRPGDVFEGAGPGTVLDGSVVLEGWTAEGATWAHTGTPAAQTQPHGVCRDDSPRCDRASELFLDGRRLRAVASLDEVGPGTWFHDEATGTAHIGDDPTSATLELSLTTFAFDGDAAGVTVRDLTVARYANPAQKGAISSLGDAWLIERVTVERSHGAGILFTGDGTVVRDVVSRENGQAGMNVSQATNSTLERVELAANNQAGFDDEWEGGGVKFTLTRGITVVDSYVHDNDGPGIWFDESAEDSTVRGNRAIANSGPGIFYEISRRGTITGNTVEGNGFGKASQGWLWGAGIVVAASWEVTVDGNDVSGNHNAVAIVQQDRGSGPFGERLVDDVTVTGNRIVLGDGRMGVVTDVESSDLFRRTITIEGNTYDVDPAAQAFLWDDEELTLDGWQAAGFS